MSTQKETTISSLENTHLTRHLGRPTRQAVKDTRRELGIIYAAAKTTHPDFLMGSRFGYAIAILTSKQFINAHNRICDGGDELDDDWEFEIPTRPTTTDPSIIQGTNDADRRKKVAEWNELLVQWERFDAYEHVFKNKLEGAYDKQYFTVLRDDLLGYTHICVSEMLDHLLEQSLALTDVEKDERLKATSRPWDQDIALATYFHNLDKLQEDLDDDDIEWTDKQKIVQAMKQMYASHNFDARDMKTWEKKPAADKTWVHLQAYFNELQTDNQQYNRATGQKHGFESAANIQELKEKKEKEDEYLVQQLGEIAMAATADKEHIQQMTDATGDMLTVIKEQSAQIKELTRQNGILISKLHKPEANAEHAAAAAAAAAIRAAAGANGERGAVTDAAKMEMLANKVKIEGGDTALKEKKGRCVVCQRHYKTAICFELECNKANRPQGWKSMFN